MELHQNKKVLHDSRTYQQNEKGANHMGKYICQRYLGERFDLQNIKRTHMTPLQEDKQSNKKMGKGLEQSLLQGGHTEVPET